MVTEGNFTTSIVEIYDLFIISLPAWAQNFVNLFFLIILVFLYSFFIWKFYRFISKKDILGLDLNKYNKTDHPFFTKLFAGAFYFLEYLVILPFVIFFWFAMFTLFLILLTDNLEVGTLLTVSAVIVAVIRLSSYYKEDLAKDLAKLLPFTLLAVSLLNQNFFDVEKILNNFATIPSFFQKIMIYLVFIIILESVLRLFDFIFSLFGLEDIEQEISEEETNQPPS
jgi:hypothetical protein